MITKTFDCVDMKNKIQEKLYNELQPKDSKDYIHKLKHSIENSDWIKKKKQIANEL